jgi:hypothetical protein
MSDINKWIVDNDALILGIDIAMALRKSTLDINECEPLLRHILEAVKIWNEKRMQMTSRRED